MRRRNFATNEAVMRLVACPSCRSAAGTSCRSASGRAVLPHIGRIAAYWALVKERA